MSRFRLEIFQALRDLIILLSPQFKRNVKAATPSLFEEPFQAKKLRNELSELRSSRLSDVASVYGRFSYTESVKYQTAKI